ncbi:MAG: LutB/LldF family L-lactate oxidation iron-sulfur protein [Sphingomonadales bacterium]|nr:LutB/LldF family L-lactate oxidation iron-sulfur protein [Sphingomonadales bacterium]
MKVASRNFAETAASALEDAQLQKALGVIQDGFVAKRAEARAALPEFDALKAEGKAIKEHALAHLDHYLERFEAEVSASGGQVHWARDGAEAGAIVARIAKEAGARRIIKGKSMVTEEAHLNQSLAAAGLEAVETDLGDYIMQLRDEPPSHLIMPALHLVRGEIAETFREHHAEFAPDRPLAERQALIKEARKVLRQRFLSADLGITGANFLVAETGTVVLVTNEGNGDLTTILPKTHIVVTGIEKVVPTLEDATTLIRLLARSATGQEISAYTSFFTGPKRANEPDGPEAFHVVLLDNGRSDLVASEFHEMMRCIRCGACLNHCPVYAAVGGHAYGSVYSGPMGAVLTPGFAGIDQARPLPEASTACGRCAEVCPVGIPIPDLMRHWRMRAFDDGLGPWPIRFGLKAWAAMSRRPWLYRMGTALAARLPRLLSKGGWITRLPGPFGGWTAHRDMAAPAGRTFQAQWRVREGRR